MRLYSLIHVLTCVPLMALACSSADDTGRTASNGATGGSSGGQTSTGGGVGATGGTGAAGSGAAFGGGGSSSGGSSSGGARNVGGMAGASGGAAGAVAAGGSAGGTGGGGSGGVSGVPANCQSSPLCHTLPGLVHKPAPGNDVQRLQFTPPAGSYSEIRLKLDVFVAKWAPQGSLHNVFWLAHNAKNFDLYGYLNFIKDGYVHFRHGLGQKQPDKVKIVVPANLPTAATYNIAYRYSVSPPEIDVDIHRAGKLVKHIDSTPNVAAIQFMAGQKLTIDLGFEQDANPNEPASYDWEYRDLAMWLVK